MLLQEPTICEQNRLAVDLCSRAAAKQGENGL
jgi:hypothetical protein